MAKYKWNFLRLSFINDCLLAILSQAVDLCSTFKFILALLAFSVFKPISQTVRIGARANPLYTPGANLGLYILS